MRISRITVWAVPRPSTVTDEVPRVLVVDHDDKVSLPNGPFLPGDHASLEDGFRQLIEAQAGLDLYYIEQLYTFGNR